MKKKLITFLSVLFIFGEINAQENCVSIDYTTKFIGKTIDLSYSLIKNKQDFSAGLVFYTNQKIRETYNSETGFPFSPVHFAPLKSAAYGKTFSERLGLQLNYKYFLNENENIQPFVFTGIVVSNIGFNIDYYTWNTNFPKMMIWDVFLGFGLNIKLSENLYLGQSISPGILYINSIKINYLSSAVSLNPMYKIGLNYYLGKQKK
ncbi:MAG: hypothetical protein L3J56_05425 [Bacteroidales bacterium]|nr:hypothetical protein [Bacteroidales bacterium]